MDDVRVGSEILVRGDLCFDLPLVAVGSCRGDPTNVDVAAATAKGIPVLRAPGRNADAVAEMAVGLLFAVTRGIPRADLDVREGETYRNGTIPYQRFRAWQVAGQTAGVVGYGAVGRAAASTYPPTSSSARSSSVSPGDGSPPLAASSATWAR